MRKVYEKAATQNLERESGEPQVDHELHLILAVAVETVIKYRCLWTCRRAEVRGE